MKSRPPNPNKEQYQQLRSLSYTQLWQEHVARFDRATPQERSQTLAVVRAVGVVCAASGSLEQKNQARGWLRKLLQDPDEKVRRYAMAAIPKLGAGPAEETDLLALMRTTTLDREKKFLTATLEKIGGPATLAQIRGTGAGFPQTEQKIKASLARADRPSVIQLDRVLSAFSPLRIHLRGRKGLEQFVRDEVQEKASGRFRVEGLSNGLVSVSPTAPFRLADLYALRCFGTAGFVLGTVSSADPERSAEAVAAMITSPLARRLFETFTEGSFRYRLEFVDKGHQRGAVRLITSRAYARCPEILNDAREASWTVAIHPLGSSASVELCPKLPTDPRFSYRQGDVPAASHPPLAACMARLAGPMDQEMVWDPFCGSGLELIERAWLGGVRHIFGSDQSAEAVAIAQQNFAAADLRGVEATFGSCDFRKFNSLKGLSRNTTTLVITNPPMGRRVPVPDLYRLIQELFSVAATVLKPGGRLVLANPVRAEIRQPLLQLQSSRIVDVGVCHCLLQKYVKR